MNYIRRAKERGAVDLGWLQSYHSFSFGQYFDANHMGVSALRVINDDTVQAGQGFGEHGHRDMEIISYVTQGALQHRDSHGNSHLVRAGEIQRMSAGTGIVHSEFNASTTDPVKFLQIWILPEHLNVTPSYEQKTVEQSAPLTPLVTPKGKDGSLSMNQDATLSRLVLESGESIELSTGARQGYLHVVSGGIEVEGINYGVGDAFGVDPHIQLRINGRTATEALWFDLPHSH